MNKSPSEQSGLGLISIQCRRKNKDAVDDAVSVFGVELNDLSGTLTPDAASLSDKLDITGKLTLTANYNPAPAISGLWLSGQISAGAWKSGRLEQRILLW